MADASSRRGSHVLLDEFFASGDDRFVGELMLVTEAPKLAALAERWKRDPRPWARAMQLRYLEQPMTTRGHNVVVKRLFKEAERRGDDELLAAFLHRFDRLVRRKRVRTWQWDPEARRAIEGERLELPRDALRGAPPPAALAQRRSLRPPDPYRALGTLFSARTRYYLRRRVVRDLRRLAFRDPARFVAAAAAALGHYRDDDLADGAAVLDSWCLLALCYRSHLALVFGGDHVELAPGHALAELTPAPRHLAAWRADAGFVALLGLVRAEARLVRLWATALLRREHVERFRNAPLDAVLPLLDHDDEQVQAFGAELLAGIVAARTLTAAEWLTMLRAPGVAAQQTVVALARPRLAATQLGLLDLVALARVPGAPLAGFAADLLGDHPDAAAAPPLLAELAQARCAAVAGRLTTWALMLLGAPARYDAGLVARFFDAPLAETRAAAWAWLRPDTPGHADPALWSRLVETPYDDARALLVGALQERAALPGVSATALVALWSSVLLNVHRGGRGKRIALQQLAATAAKNPADVPALLPVFAVALRSVRPPEARAGLAALVQAVDRAPALREAVVAAFPELRFVSAGATA
jgi:hypothetical protein